MKKISILGISEDTIAIIFDLVSELRTQDNFDIYPNKWFNTVPFLPFKKTSYTIHSVGTILPASDIFVFGVSGPKNKKTIYLDFLKSMEINEERYFSLIHDSAYVASSSKISNGVLIEPKVVISSQTQIDFGVSIKRGSLIGHHNLIGAFTDINPGVVISGKVKIGAGCTIGSGAVLKDNISIGENTIIGMGSVVTKDIPSNCVAYGNPCKIMKEF
ncbi:MAG: acetyltransferase [Algoriphagus sp.]|nr:acetyltransferase [Algoriphagus sp.]